MIFINPSFIERDPFFQLLFIKLTNHILNETSHTAAKYSVYPAQQCICESDGHYVEGFRTHVRITHLKVMLEGKYLAF